MPASAIDLKKLVRDIPDFPKPGIVFKDITPLFQDPAALTQMLDQLTEPWKDKNIDMVVGAEARGFLIGPGMAERLGCSFVPVRKPGKLPPQTLSYSYALEYGEDTLEIHVDAVSKGKRVLLVDDLLATGGTMKACAELVNQLGATIVGASFIIELNFLKGRDQLDPVEVHSLIHYDSE